MNINEDKFANKSAEEIVNDMLTQHKNNSKEALEHMQDILKDDGLILSADTKANLKKAVDILSDKGLKEGWFSKPEAKYEVKFEVYLPFKKEPAEFQIPPVVSLNDPLVKETLAKIRKRHPHSTIYIRSELGNQRIMEEKKNSSWLKNILSSDLVKNLAAVGLSTATGGVITPILTKPVSDIALKTISDSTDYQINFHGKEAYTCSVKSLPIALTLVEKAKGNYESADILKDSTIICSYSHSLKEWVINNNSSTLKEDIYTNDDITDHSYADLQKDITNLDERTKVILCKLNPSLIDVRRPKWHNTLLDTPKIVAVTPDIKSEVFIILNGIENQVAKNPDQTEVIITEKVPTNITPEGNVVYRDGEDFVITAAQFKQIISDNKNAEILAKFEKSKGSAILNDEEASYYLELDQLAKQNIDAKYPEWEQEHYEMYKLGNYTLPERAEIYLAWKDANRTTSFQQARELSPNEVDERFGLNKLKTKLKNQKDGQRILNAFEMVRNSIPEKDKVAIDTELLNILNSAEYDVSDIANIIGYYGAKTQLNQLSKGKLFNLEKDLPEDMRAAFNDKLEILISDKYVDDKTGIPLVAKKSKEAIKDINDLLNEFEKTSNSSIWNQQVDSVKQVKDVTTSILNKIKEIETINPKMAKELKDRFIGNTNTWKRNLILGDELVSKLEEFMNYTNKVAIEAINRRDEIADIEKQYPELSQSAEKNDKIKAIKDKSIPKSDQEVAHDNWIGTVKSIINPKTDEEVRDRSYYTAITNKISRLVKTDPTAANGYHKEFDKLLNTLEAKYTNPNNPKIEQALSDFLKIMKDETKGYGTLSKKLAGAL